MATATKASKKQSGAFSSAKSAVKDTFTSSTKKSKPKPSKKVRAATALKSKTRAENKAVKDAKAAEPKLADLSGYTEGLDDFSVEYVENDSAYVIVRLGKEERRCRQDAVLGAIKKLNKAVQNSY